MSRHYLDAAQTVKTSDEYCYRVPDPDDDSTRMGIISWSKVPIGFELSGHYRGTVAGPYGDLGVIDRPDGRPQKFASSALLRKRLSVVEEGQDIKIVYLGTRMPVKSSGGPYHTFDVYSKVPIFLPAGGIAGQLQAHAEPDADEVPF
jgi:hypothetical protein